MIERIHVQLQYKRTNSEHITLRISLNNSGNVYLEGKQQFKKPLFSISAVRGDSLSFSSVEHTVIPIQKRQKIAMPRSSLVEASFGNNTSFASSQANLMNTSSTPLYT